MRNFTLFFIFFSFLTNVFSQAMYRNFTSEALGGDRNIKVLKPRNYAENPDKNYPLIIVLDGDYLFEPVAGNVDYLSYWDQIPESFVVGVNQSRSRYDDCAIDLNSGFPEKQSAGFMNFVMEVRNSLMQEYRIAPFTVLVGKDITANLSSYYLMRKDAPIQGFIHIEPDYSEIIQDNLVQKFTDSKSNNSLYVAGSKKDPLLDQMFATVNNEETTSSNTVYKVIPNTNKYTVVNQAVPAGLLHIFKEYALVDVERLFKDVPIGSQEKSKDALTAVAKLKEKYELIKNVYGLKLKVRLVDYVTVAEHLLENKDYDQLFDVSALIYKDYPDILYGRFLEGMAYEGTDRIDRAVKSYNIAYTLQPAVGIETSDVLDRIESLQKKN